MVGILSFKRDFPQGMKVFEFSETVTSIIDSNLEFVLKGCIAVDTQSGMDDSSLQTQLLPPFVIDLIDTAPKHT